jgi:hypothetical protein
MPWTPPAAHRRRDPPVLLSLLSAGIPYERWHVEVVILLPC